jgi:hypothetical protein
VLLSLAVAVEVQSLQAAQLVGTVLLSLEVAAEVQPVQVA